MKLFLFTDLHAKCTFNHDVGIQVLGVVDTHPSGRPGFSFNLPDNLPDQNGCSLSIELAGKIPYFGRGLLLTASSPVAGQAIFTVDDVTLVDVPAIPEPGPEPEPEPNPDATPLEIILNTYNKGDFDLSTKEGCGEFTEACCENLHILNSDDWGHIKKAAAQNQYNGHATDAIMLLHSMGETQAGVYDIITNSESDEAVPAFNYKHEPQPELWYYPA